jgi:S1-C subfamily serine protease
VVRTAPGSPAERAGLRGVDFNATALGNVIVAMNDNTVRRRRISPMSLSETASAKRSA